MQYAMNYESPLGAITLAAEGDCVTGLWFVGQKYDLATLNTYRLSETPALARAAQWLDAYFAGENPALPQVSPKGSDFQKAVWDILLGIPYGKTTTYGAIAKLLEARGHKPCAQAVGGAVGRNPISIIIPCHRVVSASGALTGYAGGVERKKRLLGLEGALA